MWAKHAWLINGYNGYRRPLQAHEEALVRTMREIFAEPATMRAVVADLAKTFIVDPAAEGVLQPALFLNGFHAVRPY